MFYLQNWAYSKCSILGQMLKIFLIANSQPRECSTWGQTCSCPRTFISSDMKTADCSSKTFSSNICKLLHSCLPNQVCCLLSYWNPPSRKRWGQQSKYKGNVYLCMYHCLSKATSRYLIFAAFRDVSCYCKSLAGNNHTSTLLRYCFPTLDNYTITSKEL